MPNVHLTEPMQKYVKGQIKSGAYANTSEIVRAGIRLLMEKGSAPSGIGPHLVRKQGTGSSATSFTASNVNFPLTISLGGDVAQGT